MPWLCVGLYCLGCTFLLASIVDSCDQCGTAALAIAFYCKRAKMKA